MDMDINRAASASILTAIYLQQHELNSKVDHATKFPRDTPYIRLRTERPKPTLKLGVAVPGYCRVRWRRESCSINSIDHM